MRSKLNVHRMSRNAKCSYIVESQERKRELIREAEGNGDAAGLQVVDETGLQGHRDPFGRQDLQVDEGHA